MMRVLAVANQKGGVGKTTTCYHLAVALAQRGQRVLAVDLDPQAHLSLLAKVNLGTLQRSIYDVFAGVPVREVLITTEDGFDILPADPILAKAERELSAEFNRESRLKKALATVAPDYDWTLIDCPPSIGVLTHNGLVAADSVLVPVEPEALAIKGMQLLLDTIEEVREVNERLDVIGVVPTLVRRNKHHTSMLELLERTHPELRIRAAVPSSVEFGKAARYRRNIFQQAPKNPGALAYTQLAQELLGSGR